MEKLIVKNFGPIKEAEIDLTKYVVFIGDTSTGKSVLAKLIAIFRDAFSVLSAIKENDVIEISPLLKKYNIDFNIDYTEIIYLIDNQKRLELEGGKIRLLDFYFKEQVIKQFEEHIDTADKNYLFPKFLKIDKEEFYNFIISDYLSKIGTVYFPAERILISLTGNSAAGLSANNVALPECFKEFSAKYEVAKRSIVSLSSDPFNFKFTSKDGVDEILHNGQKILLSQASSGIQSVLPLFVVFAWELREDNDNFIRLFVFEEPELNLFPNKQKLLIEFLIGEISSKKENLVITTHSPYILSVLDTLMLAKNTFNEHPELKEEINAIVSEDKWIDYDDISVYEVRNDGTIKSIKNAEFKSIDTNAIDGVSDIISEQFDKLTELRYAQ